MTATANSGKRPADPGAVPRARLLDYLLLLLGCGLSLWLAELMGVRTVASPGSSLFRQAYLAVLPRLLLLPLGILLFWPIFFATQQILGRKHPLTMAEWLMGLTWLAALVLTGWIVWQATGNIPDALVTRGFRQNLLFAYMLAVLSLGALAMILWILDLLWLRPQPWTHTLTLVLLLWPSLPVACLWLGGIKLE